jgi:hypothetical protein
LEYQKDQRKPMTIQKNQGGSNPKKEQKTKKSQKSKQKKPENIPETNNHKKTNVYRLYSRNQKNQKNVWFIWVGTPKPHTNTNLFLAILTLVLFHVAWIGLSH